MKHREWINGSEEGGLKTLCPREHHVTIASYLQLRIESTYLLRILESQNPKRTHCHMIIINIPNTKPSNDNFYHLEFG